jgi:UDP-galactopyranose mutase
VAGVGVGERFPHQGAPDDRCWMYFPEADCPFYRVTNFHNYAPANVPGPHFAEGSHSAGGPQFKPGMGKSAFLCETSFSEDKPEDISGLMDRTIAGLVNTTLLPERALPKVESRYEITVDYGYPVPCLERDLALRTLQPWLEAQGIYSRGRFGGWKYEVSNMDHSVMQGVEWAQRMVQGEKETTYQWT